MITLWCIRRWGTEIRKVEALRETEKSFYVHSRYSRGYEMREPKVTEWTSHFSTWEEAHSTLKSRKESEIIRIKSNLKRAEEEYKHILGMTKED